MSSFISLFSGCGGFDHGFIEQGYECLGGYDIESSAIDVYRANVCSNIYQHDLLKASLPNQIQANKADVVIAGSPCQGFSTTGQRRFDDPRNKLLIRSADIALEIKAKVIVCENVPSVKSGRHKYYWNELIKKLSSAGYKTEEFLYDFSKHGLAQIRKRLLLIAYKGKRIEKEKMMIEHLPEKSIHEAIRKVDSAHNHQYFSFNENSNDIIIANKIKIGQKLSNVRGGERSVHTWQIPEVYGIVTDGEEQLLKAMMRLRRQLRKRNVGDADPLTEEDLETHYNYPFKRDIKSLIKKGYMIEKKAGEYDLTNTFNGKYRRLNPDKPSLTVDTYFGNPRYFLHPKENRGFSVREAARIQGFPDSFVFDGPLKKQFTMIGNAVPPLISEKLAIILKKNFF